MKKVTVLLLLLILLFPYVSFAATMYCPYCGTKVDSSYSFCPSCGKSLNNISSGTRSVSNNYIPGFLHDYNDLLQTFTILINEAKRNIGAKGKWIYTENTFPLQFAFDLREENCFENHLDKSWMFTEKDSVAGDEYINHLWYYAPKSMQYDDENFYTNNSIRLYYTHTDYLKSRKSKKWANSISFVSNERYVDIRALKTEGTLKMEVEIVDRTINTSSVKYYFTYIFEGNGNVLLYSEKNDIDSNGYGLI